MADGNTAPVSPLPAQRLLGKVVLITGGGGTIGVETAARVLRDGARVALVDISPDALATAKAKLTAFVLGGESLVDSHILLLTADVTSNSMVEEYTRKTVDEFGRLDCVFLNAGISHPSMTVLESGEEMFDRVMHVNVKSAFLGLKHAAQAMKDLGKGGSIILASSIAGLRGTPGKGVYATSKFALRGLATTAALELGEYGIRVNTIHLSGVNGPMFVQSWSEEKLKQLKAEMPLGRFAETYDVAGVVAFLAGDESQFMTGGFLKVDGGCAD
ncbi:putative short-chain dehydrogenase reductase sdr [Rosellinia necatrix]|uniref:Putative short-chain dehydrogenase reductase sdr n=1 Tax=Rosellinia necatrix TaxID=77044 RepID=A0A1S7UJQ5_ROSNE|nr:putative short-chain dehydrogenase reductase sdr [Rosellinia necatrix]